VPKLKLTDADRVILSSAGARDTGLVLPVPKSLQLSPKTLEPILRRLLAKGLLLERPLVADEKPWATSEDGTRTSLVIAPTGLEAVGLGASENSSPQTPTGTAAPRAKAKGLSKRPPSAKRPVAKPPTKPAVKAAAAVGTMSKLDTLVAALRQRKGATIPDLMEATGWQAHSVRGAISGSLKNKRKLNVVSATVEGRGRVYRISEKCRCQDSMMRWADCSPNRRSARAALRHY
jgi:hypothetical protein